MNDPKWKEKWGWLPLVLIPIVGAAGILVRPEASEPIGSGIRAVAALLLLLGLTFLGASWLKRWSHRVGRMSSNADMGIHILGVKGLGHGQSLLVVEVAGERFLLGACKDKIVYLARLTGDERVGNASSAVGEGR